MSPAPAESTLKFNGANWEDLDRMIALSNFAFLQDSDYQDNDPAKCAHLAAGFSGPALDWVATIHSSRPGIFESFPGFILACKQAFGVEANNITALRRKQLNDLRWGPDAPVFFAEFDRLTFQLGITGDDTKIAMVHPKLPLELRAELARQALDFANYETMRERLNTMWALDPHRGNTPSAKSHSGPSKKSRCGSCGKKGHSAKDCRGVKKE